MFKAVVFFSFLTALLLSNSAYAQQSPQPPPIAEEHRWLYEILLPAADREQSPVESFKAFYVHMFDSYAQFPHPQEFRVDRLKLVDRVEGKLGYVNNAIKKRYAYDVLRSSEGEFTMHVKIHFKDPVGEDLNNFRRKINLAQHIWNNSRVQLEFKYAFVFEVVEDEAAAHYSVKVFDQTRGPYDQNWGRNWSEVTIAHELGHMLGLGDEYQTLSGKVDCIRHSLMCVSSSGKLMEHHYYFVLRRLIEAIRSNSVLL